MSLKHSRGKVSHTKINMTWKQSTASKVRKQSSTTTPSPSEPATKDTVKKAAVIKSFKNLHKIYRVYMLLLGH